MVEKDINDLLIAWVKEIQGLDPEHAGGPAVLETVVSLNELARDAAKDNPGFIVSECPLARDHILQGIERLGKPVDSITPAQHPVELMARAYGL